MNEICDISGYSLLVTIMSRPGLLLNLNAQGKGEGDIRFLRLALESECWRNKSCQDHILHIVVSSSKDFYPHCFLVRVSSRKRHEPVKKYRHVPNSVLTAF